MLEVVQEIESLSESQRGLLFQALLLEKDLLNNYLLNLKPLMKMLNLKWKDMLLKTQKM